MYAEPIINVIKICGIGIWTIFDAVSRYLPFFLTVFRYYVPPNVPLVLQKHSYDNQNIKQTALIII